MCERGDSLKRSTPKVDTDPGDTNARVVHLLRYMGGRRGHLHDADKWDDIGEEFMIARRQLLELWRCDPAGIRGNHEHMQHDWHSYLFGM